MKRLLLGIVCLAAILFGCAASPGRTSNGTPTDSSPEAGFARDMSVHHAQAVALAEAIGDRTQDPELKIMATNIALGQQAQIGRMTGWLDEWNLTVTSNRPAMAWTAMAGMDMPVGAMPGMATRPQITALSTLALADAEVSFLHLMIAHHKGGVQMAQEILLRTTRADVVLLATAIVNSQRSEIAAMTEMLSARGAVP
jgi:uncharacterized protein (DUF305 family)